MSLSSTGVGWMGVPMDTTSMIRAITIMPGFVVPSFGISYLEQWRIRCVVDFGELDKRWNLPFCLLVISSVGLCLLWFHLECPFFHPDNTLPNLVAATLPKTQTQHRRQVVVCAAFAFGCGGYHCYDVLLKSCGQTFKSIFAILSILLYLITAWFMKSCELLILPRSYLSTWFRTHCAHVSGCLILV